MTYRTIRLCSKGYLEDEILNLKKILKDIPTMSLIRQF